MRICLLVILTLIAAGCTTEVSASKAPVYPFLAPVERVLRRDHIPRRHCACQVFPVGIHGGDTALPIADGSREG